MHELGVLSDRVSGTKWSGIRYQVVGYQVPSGWVSGTKWSGIRYQVVGYQQYSCEGGMCGITVHLSIGNTVVES